MKRFLGVFLAFLGIFFLSGNLYALADSAPLAGASGGSLRSYHDENVKMVSEKVTMKVVSPQAPTDIEPSHGEYADVEVSYIFQNMTNKPITMTTGFPERDFLAPLQDFKAFVEGKEVATQRMQGESFYPTPDDFRDSYDEYWITYQLNFKPGETLHVTNTYHQDPVGGIGSGGYYAGYQYILDTGSTWKDSIDKVEVVIEFVESKDGYSSYNLSRINPVYQDYPWVVSEDKRVLSLTLYDVEPTANDNISFIITDRVSNNISNCNWKVDELYQIDKPEVSTATSVKSPKTTPRYEMAYYPCQAFDGEKSTAWVTADGENPVGSRLTYNYTNPVINMFEAQVTRSGRVFDALYVLGGKDGASRPKDITLNIGTGGDVLYSTSLQLPDSANDIMIPLPKRLVFNSVGGEELLHVAVAIDSVYKGVTSSNLAINEFELLSYPQGLYPQPSAADVVFGRQSLAYDYSDYPAGGQTEMVESAVNQAQVWPWIVSTIFFFSTTVGSVIVLLVKKEE